MRSTLLLLLFISACAPTDDIDDSPFEQTTCEVTRRDVVTGVVTNQFVFSELGLVSHAWQAGEGTRGIRINTYQEGRLVQGATEIWIRANESQTFGPWLQRLAVHSSDTYTHHELTFAYDSEGRLIKWDTKALTSDKDTKRVSLRRIVYTRNVDGKKIRTDQYSGDASQPWITKTYTYCPKDGRRKYICPRGRLESIQTVQSGRTRKVRLIYDEGKMVRWGMNEFTKARYDFDENGLLIGWNGQRWFTRNSDGLIIAATRGTPVQYSYEDGRLVAAHYDNGSAYTQTYSTGCPAGFTHTLVTPNTLYLEHYEAPPLHHTWSSY